MQDEPGWIQMRERRPELFEFVSWAVDFEADECGQVQRLGKHGADVLEMLEKRFGVHVTFAAKNFVAVYGELIEKIAGFIARLGRNSGRIPFRKSSLSGGTLKYGWRLTNPERRFMRTA
jgi:hypothetical protein